MNVLNNFFASLFSLVEYLQVLPGVYPRVFT